MNISDVSKKTGLSVSAIRFYEKQGLIPQNYISRGSNNYRDFSMDIVDYLLMIKTIHSAGFLLSEIKEIQKSNTLPISTDKKIELLEKKIDEVNAQRENLNRTETILKKMLRNKVNAIIKGRQD